MDDRAAVDRLLTEYNQAWNEPDPAARRGAVERLWAPDGTVVNREHSYRGPDGVFEALTRAHDDFVARGYRFRPLGTAAHHDGVSFRWAMDPADGGAPEAVGTNFLLLDLEGRIRVDHQFVDGQ